MGNVPGAEAGSESGDCARVRVATLQEGLWCSGVGGRMTGTRREGFEGGDSSVGDWRRVAEGITTKIQAKIINNNNTRTRLGPALRVRLYPAAMMTGVYKQVRVASLCQANGAKQDFHQAGVVGTGLAIRLMVGSWYCEPVLVCARSADRIDLGRPGESPIAWNFPCPISAVLPLYQITLVLLHYKYFRENADQYIPVSLSRIFCTSGVGEQIQTSDGWGQRAEPSSVQGHLYENA